VPHVQHLGVAEKIQVGHDHLVVRVSSPEVLALDVTIPPGGGPPALHRHAPAEIYRVLDGELAFYFGDGPRIRREAGGAGAVVDIPAGVEHTVRNETGAPANAYVTFVGDAAPMEAFVRAAARLAEAGPPDLEAVMATAAAHGVEITRPIAA
jgi:mannose-6-phosphate isomerase-like protein (cupin superfamily)